MLPDEGVGEGLLEPETVVDINGGDVASLEVASLGAPLSCAQ